MWSEVYHINMIVVFRTNNKNKTIAINMSDVIMDGAIPVETHLLLILTEQQKENVEENVENFMFCHHIILELGCRAPLGLCR